MNKKLVYGVKCITVFTSISTVLGMTLQSQCTTLKVLEWLDSLEPLKCLVHLQSSSQFIYTVRCDLILTEAAECQKTQKCDNSREGKGRGSGGQLLPWGLSPTEMTVAGFKYKYVPN